MNILQREQEGEERAVAKFWLLDTLSVHPKNVDPKLLMDPF